MNDLAPAEQARAARWVKDWLLKCEFVESETAQDVITALGFYIEKLDPPETVESLRAERDEAREKLVQAECVIRDFQTANRLVREERDEALRAHERFEGEQEELVQALNKLSAANYTIACLRVLMRAATATPREHWLGGDHSNQTPYPVVRE